MHKTTHEKPADRFELLERAALRPLPERPLHVRERRLTRRVSNESLVDIDTVRYKVGTANVDLVDARQKRLIWTGVAEGRLSEEFMKNPQPAIANVVNQMFIQFPGHAGAGN